MEDGIVNVKTDSIYDITNPFETLQIEENKQVGLSPRNSEVDISDSCGAKWLHVRDSLEGITQASTSTSSHSVVASSERILLDRHSAPARTEQRRSVVTGHAHSDSRLIATSSSASGPRRHHLNLSKILSWDPWNKIGRKGKKDKGRKKGSIGPVGSTSLSGNSGNLGHSSGDRQEAAAAPILRRTQVAAPEETELAVSQQANGDSADDLRRLEDGAEDPSHENKCVRFQRDVQVVYFAGDQVLQTGMEPLRREQEQQERNKELRGRDLIGPAFPHSSAQHSGLRNVLRRAHSQQEHWK